MKHKGKIITFISLVLVSFAVYYLFFTTPGSANTAGFLLSHYTNAESISIKNISGSFARTLELNDIIIYNIKGLPADNKLKIQKAALKPGFPDFWNLKIDVHNGKIILTGALEALFYGVYNNGEINLNLYSNQVNIKRLIEQFSEGKGAAKISGVVNNLDINIKGPLAKPEISGKFIIKELSRNGFSVVKCPGELALVLQDINKDLKLSGDIIIESGLLSGKKTALINLKPSKISFFGDPLKPVLDLRATSLVEKTQIYIYLKGTLDKPDLRLTSEPSAPQAKLLIMLATGKSWQGMETAVKNGAVPNNLVVDFIDYFLFSGSTNKITEKLGVSEFSATLDQESKGISLKKDLSEKTKASYGVEQSQSKENTSSTSQKVGVEQKINKNIYLEAETQNKQESKTDNTEKTTNIENKVLLKYKKDF